MAGVHALLRALRRRGSRLPAAEERTGSDVDDAAAAADQLAVRGTKLGPKAGESDGAALDLEAEDATAVAKGTGGEEKKEKEKKEEEEKEEKRASAEESHEREADGTACAAQGSEERAAADADDESR